MRDLKITRLHPQLDQIATCPKSYGGGAHVGRGAPVRQSLEPDHHHRRPGRIGPILNDRRGP
ncbi:hypothetical protein HUJ05_010978 [Dendroctonus ponderosae]|nr:hypothetical protein HUJ05_010978 [Dendroctonus ponderosae]